MYYRCCSYLCKTRDCLRTHRDNLDDPFVRDSNFIAILKGFANMDDTSKNHLVNGLKMQKCVQRKFRMKSLLALENLFELKFKILWKKRNNRYSNKEILLLCLSCLNIDRKIGVPVIEEISLDSNHI